MLGGVRAWRPDALLRLLPLARPLCSDASAMHDSAEALLDKFVNWEQKGVPQAAGTADSNAFDLGRMRRLLAKLGDPHMNWKAVHIAGSKGKGSTATLLSNILHSSGLKVGVYTSPHVHNLSERIAVQPGAPMSPAQLDGLVHKHWSVLESSQEEEQGKLSHFEAITALAYRYFADEKVDLAVVETGLGGLTDATNVIPPEKLELAVITPLGLEHVDALGGSLESIAAAKAGIMKPGRPVVIAEQQHASALGVLLKEAEKIGSPVIQAGQRASVEHLEYQLHSSGITSGARQLVSVSTSTKCGSQQQVIGSTLLGLVGRHQMTNVCTAVAAASVLSEAGWRIPSSSILQGLADAQLPCRFQVVPLHRGLPLDQATYAVLDGAHTSESASALVSTLRDVFPGLPLVLVVAMASDKDHAAVMAALRPAGPKVVIFTSASIAGSRIRAAAPGALSAQWEVATMMSPKPPPRCRQHIMASLRAALAKAKQELSAFQGPGVICFTGSLHAAAQAGDMVMRNEE